MNLFLSAFASSLLAVSVAGERIEQSCELPDIFDIIGLAFPTYEVDENGSKVEGSDGRWTPLYYTKKWNGLDHPLAYPSPIDTRYPFESAAPFLGQPGAGSPHHCPEDSPVDQKVQECPKVTTTSDDGLFGAGHIPALIALRSIRDSYLECNSDLSEWFDFEESECRVKPDMLLSLIRKYYPRDEDGKVDYPPPFNPDTPEFYPFEYPSPEGNPHWCSAEFVAAGQYADWCPYVYNGTLYEGPDAGIYRHPHLALASLEQYLANIAIPEKCGLEWNSDYPLSPDSSWDWVEMISDDPKSQPKTPYAWPVSGQGTVKNVISISMAPEIFAVTATSAPASAPAASSTIRNVGGIAFAALSVASTMFAAGMM
jgi:hypothetical protein